MPRIPSIIAPVARRGRYIHDATGKPVMTVYPEGDEAEQIGEALVRVLNGGTAALPLRASKRTLRLGRSRHIAAFVWASVPHPEAVADAVAAAARENCSRA